MRDVQEEKNISTLRQKEKKTKTIPEFGKRKITVSLNKKTNGGRMNAFKHTRKKTNFGKEIVTPKRKF